MEAISMLFDAVVKEALETIVKKIREGKKLSDAEVLLLVVSQMRKEQELIIKMFEEFKNDVNRRLDEFKNDVNKRFDEFKGYVEKRFERIESEIGDLKDEIKFLRQEVMSIKSDIINLLKEKI